MLQILEAPSTAPFLDTRKQTGLGSGHSASGPVQAFRPPMQTIVRIFVALNLSGNNEKLHFPKQLMVRERGLEPPPLSGPDPKSGASAVSPLAHQRVRRGEPCHKTRLPSSGQRTLKRNAARNASSKSRLVDDDDHFPPFASSIKKLDAITAEAPRAPSQKS